jgi:citrate synthase
MNMAAPTAPAASQVKAGLEGVVATETKLSMVDGQNGVLIIAGYSIEEFASKVSIEEAAMLLWTGNLPSVEEVPGIQKELAAYRALRYLTGAVALSSSVPPFVSVRGNRPIRSACC